MKEVKSSNLTTQNHDNLEMENEEMETREMKKLKKRFFSTITVIFLVIFAFFTIIKIVSLPQLHVKDEAITRDLAWMILPMDMEPTNREIAWDSELPEFVRQDIAYAEQNDCEIEYEFKGNIMRIEKREGEWRIDLKTRMDTGSTWDSLTNFSMYQTEDHKIVIYGYCFRGDWFQKITLQKNESRIDTITYDASLPLKEFPGGESIGAMHVGGYSLMQSAQTFTFYKDGYLIFSQGFPHGKIKDIDLYRGLILTEGKKLYMMYVEFSDRVPTLTFTYVGTVDMLTKMLYYSDNLKSVEEDRSYLAMVQKDGKYYAVVPKDWESFDRYSLARANGEIYPPSTEFNYALELIELQKSLKEACFHCPSSQWYVTMVFDFNGREFYNNYFFGGYDNETRLPEEIASHFMEKSVTSFDEMWETIETIRTAYFDYYEHRGDFVPAVLFFCPQILLFYLRNRKIYFIKRIY